MILNLNDQGLETVNSLFDYATLYEVLEEVHCLESQQGEQYVETLILELLSALENEDDPRIIEQILAQIRQAKISS